MKTLYALLWKEFICHIKRPISLLFEFGIVVLMWYSATEHIEHNINMKIDIKKAEPEERSIDIQRSYLALYLPATNFTRSLFYNESIKGIEYTTVEEYEEYMYYEKEWIYFIGTFTFYEMDGKQYLNETRLTRLMQNGFLIEVTRMQQIPQVSINPLKMFNKFIWQAFITNIGDRSDSLPEISTVEMKWGEEMSITLVEVVFEISATIALLYPLFLLIKNIVAEKQSKLLELMRIAGVNKRDYFLAAFIFKFLSLIPFIVLFTKAYGQLIDTPLTVLLLLLYVTSSILFVMALSVLFTRSDIASGFFAVMWFITVPIQFSGDFIFKYDISRAIVASCVFLPPNCALLFFTAKTSFLAASYKKKLAFDTLFTKTPMMESVSAGHFLVAMGCGALFWVLFIAYVGEVWPWQDGIPKPFHFPISYFFKRKEEKSVQIEEGDQVYFEKVNAENLEQAIGIEKVRKKYESTGDVVLKSISLQVYRGQITILLGHNGAGKTTLFNIICGMFSPTSGKILVNGFNIKTDTKAARKRLGMCPQSEILFENLSVAYHLYFFGLLKEGKISALNAEISNILKLLNLEDKRTFLPKQLSGGMKRRLQLAIALIGGTDTLILDEPTSGLDVETRRSVWDFLLSVRKQYAILLTTHHMEEADILGDRIAIMSHGEIKCCGSPMFLKRVFGLGYVLRFEKRAEFKGVECRAFLQKHFNELQTVKESEYEFVCKIRKEESAKLGKFFDVASKMRDELGFTSIGLTASTMDDVFIQVGVLFEKQEKSDMSEIRQLKEISLQKPSNLSLFKIIFIKRFTYMKHKWLISLIIVLFCAATSLLDEYLLGSFVRSSIFLPELKFLPDKLNCICLGEESYCDYVQKMGESFGANFKFVRSLTIDSVRKSPEDFRETPVIAFKCENIPMQPKDCQISNITLVVEFFSAEFVLETVAINMLLALRLNKSLDRPIFKYSIILQRDYASPNSSNVGSIDYSGIDYLEITIGILIQALIAIACFVSLILIETFKSFRRVAQEYQARDADDEDVAAERMRTEQIIREGKMESQALVAYNLTKVYGHSIVVDHLSFSVSKNQCFGLLGVNGAGKTTTFKMLIGELAATYGEAFIGKLSLFDDRLEYLRQIGYCPQFDSFVNNLTGTENLKLFAKLRGYKGKEVNSIVTSVINFVDLQDHASKEANLCSGGNKRKLSIGMALIGFPKLIFLDEPTSSVDPVARRKIWAIIEALSSGLDCSFVLCSHSMDECQQLCNIISILTKGKFKCMGSTQHLKEKLGKGYTVILKIDQTINNGDLLSAEMKLRFPNAVLRETHQSAIEYTIPALWTSLGEIFASLEQMKEEFKLEDFQVKDTELEQIFLQIAKEK
ncbi:ATP-binding cassette sub-family A member 1-like protein [Dinothrombium tinctorium]|uniref:ATP-binding cassette sub-family A member 1-like protein n=1 Tax=Dinothrombium tinctorium TaxID=1965070 RepID=A0A3S3RYP8_9ACAR|nr:ATP-binding cassette sub-family A member 1-like protein [Dinothrombium tinctorium]